MNSLTDRSKGVLLLWILFVIMFHVCLYFTVLSVPCSLVVTFWERAELLALLCVMFLCVFLLSHIESWVRYGTPDLCLLLYFIIFFTFDSKIE